MDTLWVYDGVAYHSRDLAILHGADELSLYSVKYNDTLDYDIDIDVKFDTVTFTECYDQIEIKTTSDVDFFELDFSTRLLSKDMKGKIEDALYIFAEESKYNELDDIDDKA